MRYRTYLLGLIIASLSGLVSGCGSSGDSTPVQTTTISGSVIAGRVGGATVTVKDPAGSKIAGPVTTASDGTYAVSIPDSALPGDLVIESDGGSFTDEATGNSSVSAGKLSAYVSGGSLSAGSEVHITPSSTIFRNLVAGGKTTAEAGTHFSHAFGFAPDLSVKPEEATNPSADAAEGNKLAGLRTAAFSQITKELGLPPQDQFHLLTALAQDLSDGMLNGADASGPVDIATGNPIPEDIQNRFERALMNFRSGGKDMTGLTPDKIGLLPFSKIVLTANYRIEYVEGMMAARQGKTQFRLKISDRSTGDPVTGLTLMLMPMMYMGNMMNHSTPVDGCVAGSSAGEYECKIYYLMASSMANGMSMGYWELKVTAGMGMAGESAYFYPNVIMGMGDTARTDLQGQSDKIMGMTGAENRKYFLFKDNLTGMTGNHTLKLFIATKEGMMSYPSVYKGRTLKDENVASWTLNDLTVDVTTDEAAGCKSGWTSATDDGNGLWAAAGLTGLTNGAQGKVYVRLYSKGEWKTTDGGTLKTEDCSNGYQIFTVTPGGM